MLATFFLIFKIFLPPTSVFFLGGPMTDLIKDDVQKKISGLGERIKKLESHLSENYHSADQKRFEMETNSAIAELSYSMVTSNATLPGIANIVLNYAKVFTKSEIGYASSIDPKTGHHAP
jgi:hypothetical protein